VRDTVVLGRVGILDNIVRIGHLLLDEFNSDLFRVRGRASKEGMVGEETIADTGGGLVLLVSELRTKGLDMGAVSRGGAGNSDHGSEEGIGLGL